MENPSENDMESVKPIIKACDTCRKKKLRCVVVQNSCRRCIKLNTKCVFTPVRTNKGPRRPPGYKHVEHLEERLKNMEALLQGQSWRPVSNSDDIEGAQNNVADVVEQVDETQTLSSNTRGSQDARDHRSRKRKRIAVQRDCESLPDAEKANYPTQDAHRLVEGQAQPEFIDWKLTETSPIFVRNEIISLPSKDDAQLLVRETFQSFNSAFPIFDPLDFQSTFELRYGNRDRDDPGWWACLNVIFAFAYRFRAMRSLDSKSEQFYAWGHLQNALAVVSELTILAPKLMAIQALLGMAILLQGTSSPEPTSILVSTTIKLAQSMNLHRRYHGSELTAAEVEQRKRVFWLAYIYDKDISLRTTSPPAQDEDNMDVELPTETIDLHPERLSGLNFYNYHIGLSIIQGQIYQRLFSIRAQKRPDFERALVANELGDMLDTWKRSIPLAGLNGGSSSVLDVSSFFTLLHTIILKITYFHALDIVCSSIPADHNRGELYTLCLNEARESLQLLPILPQGDYACVWLLLDFIFSAASIILSHTISHPNTASATEDLDLVDPVFDLLLCLGGTGRASDITKMENSLKSLKAEALTVIEAARNNSQRALRIDRESENARNSTTKPITTVEEFIARIQKLSAQKCEELRLQNSLRSGSEQVNS